jgi:hypothetical protein
MGQSQLALLGFFSQDMTLKSVLSFDLSGTSNFKTFLGAGFGFHFRHNFPNLFKLNLLTYCESKVKSRNLESP